MLPRVLVVCALALAGCAPPRLAPPPAAESCPAELPALVDVATLRPPPRVEVRYATPDNFVGRPLPGYDAPRALLRPEAAQALARVQQRLQPQGLGLKVWDAYRPVRATLAMVEWAESTGRRWVLDQGYVARESGHNRGATIDLTLVRLGSGEELEMGTPYDEFSERAHTANAVGEVARNRETLRQAMGAEGWRNYEKEWWHYSHGSVTHPPLDVPLRCFR